ncbi:TonB family protein [Flammeovirgaceae bacterium 311]|nr:TonB family protein [Flammeovirgaceae bacterium 311]
MRLAFLLLFISTTLFGQEKRFFTPYFQSMTDEKTSQERIFSFDDQQTTIEDYKEGQLVEKGIIYGLTDIIKINEFAWYCISQGNKNNYRSYFDNVKGTFEFYEKGQLCKRVIFNGIEVKYAQVWNQDGQEILTNGSGETSDTSENGDEQFYVKYSDSTLVMYYGVRIQKQDTIYYTVDKLAAPKEGVQSFYNRLFKVLKYPGFARLAGIEGRVYIEFIVDERGKLIEFKPLTNEGYNFEAKVIKKLEKFPDWNPAVYQNKFVKTRRVLPVVFRLED